MLDRIAGILAAPSGRVVVVTERLGGARTAGRLAERLGQQGFRVLPVIAAEALQGIPLAAFGPMLADAAPDASLADRLHALYTSVAPSRVRAVLLVEQAEHLDDASAAAIGQLVRASGVQAIVTGARLPASLAALGDDGRLESLDALLSAPEADALRLEHVVARAERGAVDIEDLEWAARAAYDARDYETTIGLARLAVRTAEAHAEPAPIGALATLADALSTTEQLDEADEVYAAAIAAAAHGSDPRVVELVFSMGAHWYVRRGDPDRAIELTEAAFDLVDDPGLRLRMTTRAEQLRFMAGRGAATASEAPTPVASAAASATPPEAITGLNTGGLVYRMHAGLYAGALSDLRATAEQARAVLLVSPEQAWPVIEVVEFIDYLALLVDGRGGEAETKAHAHRAANADDPNAIGMWDLAVAMSRYCAGDYAGALRAAQTAVEHLGRRDFIAALGPARATLAAVAALEGRTSFARSTLESIGAGGRENVHTDLIAAEAEAWLLAADRDPAAGAAVIERAVARGLEASHTTYAALTASVAVRIGQPELVLGQLRDAARRAPEARLLPLLLAYAEAAVGRDPDRLLDSAASLALAGQLGAATDAAALAADLGAADAHALAAAYRAGGLTPPVSTVGAPLSRREREVVSLAAERLRNREIAERLGLSERTVENYLANAFRKLGVRRREDLAARDRR